MDKPLRANRQPAFMGTITGQCCRPTFCTSITVAPLPSQNCWTGYGTLESLFPVGNSASFFIELLSNEGQVIQLEGVPGTSAARERGTGFENIMENSNIEIVASQPADFDRTKALNVTENLLQANPDVKAIFAQNDEMALGAIKAVEWVQRK